MFYLFLHAFKTIINIERYFKLGCVNIQSNLTLEKYFNDNWMPLGSFETEKKRILRPEWFISSSFGTRRAQISSDIIIHHIPRNMPSSFCFQLDFFNDGRIGLDILRSYDVCVCALSVHMKGLPWRHLKCPNRQI